MTVLSDIVNANIKEDDAFMYFSVGVIIVSGIVYVKRNQKQFPDLNSTLNVKLLTTVIILFILLLWTVLEAGSGVSSPPLQMIALLELGFAVSSRGFFILDTILKKRYSKIMVLVPTIIHTIFIVGYALNQYTTLFRTTNFIGKSFNLVRIPSKNTTLSNIILVYLVGELIVIGFHDLQLYRNYKNPATISSICSPKTKSLTSACLIHVRQNKTFYIMSCRLLAILVYTSFYFKFQSARRD